MIVTLGEVRYGAFLAVASQDCKAFSIFFKDLQEFDYPDTEDTFRSKMTVSFLSDRAKLINLAYQAPVSN